LFSPDLDQHPAIHFLRAQLPDQLCPGEVAVGESKKDFVIVEMFSLRFSVVMLDPEFASVPVKTFIYPTE
jgi:hypothetical protein